MIRNFGRINDNFYRGAQPRVGEHRNEYAELAAMGVRTVIDLCDEHDRKDYARIAARKAALRNQWLPMIDHDYPAHETAPIFLDFATDPTLQPIFLHCAGGRHRTGAMTAVYRMKVDGWSLKDAMRELESYDFGWLHWRWIGHGAIKQFVKDYAKEIGKCPTDITH
jgi:tyrosine-protein phosphatase SIW14